MCLLGIGQSLEEDREVNGWMDIIDSFFSYLKKNCKNKAVGVLFKKEVKFK